MPDDNLQYDLFLSHASEDTEWCEMLATRLRNLGVRVWFDKWELRGGDKLERRLNAAMKQSRKMVVVWTASYFADGKEWTRAEAEAFSQLHPDPLASERRLIPVWRADCEIAPLLLSLIRIDFRNDDDFELRLRELYEALDMPKHEFARDEDLAFEEMLDRPLDKAERGRRSYTRGKRFEDEVAALYRLLGWEVQPYSELGEPHLTIEKRDSGFLNQAIVVCADKRITAQERDAIFAQRVRAEKRLPHHRWIVVSSQGFDGDTRAELTGPNLSCVTYAELLRTLAPLDEYVKRLIESYDEWRVENWRGEDWFVRPDVRQDITGKDFTALQYISDWLGQSNKHQLVILGDVGSGKSTLLRFLAYNLAQQYLKDPVRHPAPVLIPLGEVHKETTLKAIVDEHFSLRDFDNVNYRNFLHLVKDGKIILFFDAFDEMADRVTEQESLNNFRQLSLAAEGRGKVFVTSRITYFKDVDEQRDIIDRAWRTAFSKEKASYKILRERAGNEVVYLKPFDETQIRAYLAQARPATAAQDWQKIEQIYDLRGLAQLPLLLDMIRDSLDKFAPGERVDAAKLYERYTSDWITREDLIGRYRLRGADKLRLMQELAWRLWNNPDEPMRYAELAKFVEEMRAAGALQLRGREIEDIITAIHLRSFLKREGEYGFAFIHRSFMEYFLARKLYDSLTDGRRSGTELLATHRFNKRIIHFLTMLDIAERLVAPLQTILTEGYQPQVSENALEMLYWGGRIRCQMEEEVSDWAQLGETLATRLPQRAQLAGANLREAVLEGACLVEADFTGADLAKANLNRARLDGAQFTGAKLTEAQLQSAAAVAGVSFKQAQLRGASFLAATLTGSDFSDAEYDDSSFKDAVLTGAVGLARVIDRLDHTRLRPVVQLGASSQVNVVAYSLDGELLTSAGGDGVIRLYRASDGALLHTMEVGSAINAVAFAPDGATLASGSHDGSVKLWQVASGQLLRTLDGHRSWVSAMVFAPDGVTLASGSDDGSVKLWQVASGQLLRTLDGHQRMVSAIAFAPDGATLASGSDDNSVKLWQVASGQLLRTLDGHQRMVSAIAFAPDGATLASGSDDNSVKLWQVASGQLLRTLDGHQKGVISVAFAPDGATLASGSWDNSVKLWQVASGQLLRTLDGHQNAVVSVAFAPDGATLASGSWDNSVKLWQVASGQLLRTLGGHRHRVRSVAFAPDGVALASGGDDNSVKLWQVASGQLLRTLDGHHAVIRSVAFAPDGATLASGSYDKSVKLWQVESGQLLHTLDNRRGSVTSVAFAPDGATLASGSADQSVKLWQVGSGQLLHTLAGHQRVVRSVAFAPDGATLASGSDDQLVKLWQIGSWQLLLRLASHRDGVNAVAFAPDGATLASGCVDNSVKLWQVASGQLLRTLDGHQRMVSAIAFAPDGATLASGSDDQSVKLWQVETGQLLQTFTGHLGPVYAVAFAPNGKYLVAAGAAGRLQFWDVASGQTVLYLYAFEAGAWLALLPDGRFACDEAGEALRWLGYTELGTLRHWKAADWQREFHDPQAVAEVLARYAG